MPPLGRNLQVGAPRGFRVDTRRLRPETHVIEPHLLVTFRNVLHQRITGKELHVKDILGKTHNKTAASHPHGSQARVHSGSSLGRPWRGPRPRPPGPAAVRWPPSSRPTALPDSPASLAAGPAGSPRCGSSRGFILLCFSWVVQGKPSFLPNRPWPQGLEALGSGGRSLRDSDGGSARRHGGQSRLSRPPPQGLRGEKGPRRSRTPRRQGARCVR